MIEELIAIEKTSIMSLLEKPEIWKSVDVNYHPPRVERMWTDIGEKRLSLHILHTCKPGEALYHPHPWASAVHVLYGTYETGIGYGPEDKLIAEIGRMIMKGNDYYEMLNPDGWHYVRPVDSTCMTVMLTDKPWKRWSPKSEEKLQPLSEDKTKSMLDKFKNHYFLLSALA